jgi:diguanylate cyclase (GGDEF)-like protein/PAS domain S-box-containing protein
LAEIYWDVRCRLYPKVGIVLIADLIEQIANSLRNGQSRQNFIFRLIFVCGVTAGYTLFVSWLHASIGDAVFIAVIFPVLLAGWLFGALGGVVFSLLAIVLNLLLIISMNLDQGPIVSRFGYSIYVFLIILLGLATGWVAEMRRGWRDERLRRRLLEFRPSESGQISQTILEHSPVGITVRNHDGELLFYNSAWLQIWGLDDDRVADQEARTRRLPFSQRYPHLAKYTEAINEIFQKGGELFIAEIPAQRHDNGETIWISQYLYALQDAKEQVDKVVLMTQDVTQRFETQEIIKESEKRYRGIFDHANDINLILHESVIIDCNQRALDLFGISRDQILGQDPSNFSPLYQPEGSLSAEKLNEKIVAALEGKPQRFEWLHQRQDGEPFMVEVSLNRLDFPSGPQILAALRDITERKRSEDVQTAIYRISEAANSSTGLQELFTTIHAILNELIAAENMFIALYDAEKDLITFPYFVDQYDPAPEPRQPSGGLTEFVLHTQQPQLISPERFDLLVEEGQVTNIGTPSVDWLGVPLKVEDQIIGVLGTQTYQPGVRFGKAERDIVSFVSDQIAMAVHRKRGEERLKYLSIHDPLTGLYNRAYFEEELARLERGRKFPVSVLVADLDGLKKINDQYGHAAGDQALCQAASLLQNAFRAEDGLARIGGDEFAVLLPKVGRVEADEVVERVHCLLAEYTRASKGPVFDISIGIATCDAGSPVGDRTARREEGSIPKFLNEAMRLADERMYQDKKRHKHVSANP